MKFILNVKVVGMGLLTALNDKEGNPVIRDGKEVKYIEVIGEIPVKDEFGDNTTKKDVYAIKFWNDKANEIITTKDILDKQVDIAGYVSSRHWKDESTNKSGFSSEFTGRAFKVVAQ